MLEAAKRLVVHFLIEELAELDSVAEERARDVDLVGADNDDALAAEQLLGHLWGQATEEMALAVDDDEFLEHPGSCVLAIKLIWHL